MHWIQFVWMEVPSVVLTLEVLAVELVEWMWCEAVEWMDGKEGVAEGVEYGTELVKRVVG